jgi:hypothetical protein
LLKSGAVRLAPLDGWALDGIIAFEERYAGVGAQLADAALMHIAEREHIDIVFALDRRDISVYRITDGNALTLPAG